MLRGAGGQSASCRFAARPKIGQPPPAPQPPRKSVLDSDSHVFGLTECHDGLTPIFYRTPCTLFAPCTLLDFLVKYLTMRPT